MLLRVNPNRMELLRLRRRLALATRGHKLLQDKLEEMARRFMTLLKDIDRAKDDFQKKIRQTIQNLLYCRLTSSKDSFENTLSHIHADIRISSATV